MADRIEPGSCRSEYGLQYWEEMAPMASPELAAAIGAGRGVSFSDFTMQGKLSYPEIHQGCSGLGRLEGAVQLALLRQPERLASGNEEHLFADDRRSDPGQGIALGSVVLLKSELESGRLVWLSEGSLKTNRGYYMCRDEQSALSADASRLAEFLVSSSAISANTN